MDPHPSPQGSPRPTTDSGVVAALRRELEVALEQTRATAARLEGALEVAQARNLNDPEPDRLVGASDRPFGLCRSRFKRMAREGKFKTIIGPRERVEAWASHVKKALDEEMTRNPALPERACSSDPLEQALASGRLAEATRST